MSKSTAYEIGSSVPRGKRRDPEGSRDTATEPCISIVAAPTWVKKFPPSRSSTISARLSAPGDTPVASTTGRPPRLVRRSLLSLPSTQLPAR